MKASTSWDGFYHRIEADVKLATTYDDRYQGFVVRAQDDLNKVVAWASKSKFFFTVFVNGEEVVSRGGLVEPGWPVDTVSAAIEVQGNTYRLYVNGVLRSVFTDTTFSQGKPGVAYRDAHGGTHKGYRFDNVRVTALD